MILTHPEEHIGEAYVPGPCFDNFFTDGQRLGKRNGKLCIKVFSDNSGKVKSRSSTAIAAAVCWLPGLGQSHEKPEGGP